MFVCVVSKLCVSVCACACFEYVCVCFDAIALVKGHEGVEAPKSMHPF